MDDEEEEIDIEESLIINRFYFEALKEQFNCPICLCLLKNPLMCSYCEATFCKKCITNWISKNDTCPMRCPKDQSNIVNINRTVKKNLDGLKLKCKHSCEVPFLSYAMHVKNSHKDDVKCWNCEKVSSKYNMKQIKEDNINIKELMETLTMKDEQVVLLKEEVNSKNKEIMELKNKIGSIIENKNKEKEIESLILKAKNEDLEAAIKLKEKEINSLKEKYEEQKQALKPKKGEINILKSKIEDYEEALSLFFSIDLTREHIKTSESLLKKIKDFNEHPIKKSDSANSKNDLRDTLKNVNLTNIEVNLEVFKENESELKDSLSNLVKNKTSLTSLKYKTHHVKENENERNIEKIQTTFKNVKKVTTKDYQFFNENKTVRKMRENKIGIYCIDKVKVEGIQEFSIKIDTINFETEDISILFGFTVLGTGCLEGFYRTRTSWMCCLNSGGFYNTGDLEYSFMEKWIKPNVGDVYGICLDNENDEVFLKKNGNIASSGLKMFINKKQKKNLYPCVDILNTGFAVSIS